MNIKQAIIDRLRATKRENIEKVIDYMEKHGFFSYHCHRHHHYDGGLADHAWQTYQIALRLDRERCASNPNAQKKDEDSIGYSVTKHYRIPLAPYSFFIVYITSSFHSKC